MLSSEARLFEWARHGRPPTLTSFGLLAYHWRPLINGAERRGGRRRKKRDMAAIANGGKRTWTPWLWTK